LPCLEALLGVRWAALPLLVGVAGVAGADEISDDASLSGVDADTALRLAEGMIAV
jgi:hypothetical protein